MWCSKSHYLFKLKNVLSPTPTPETGVLEWLTGRKIIFLRVKIEKYVLTFYLSITHTRQVFKKSLECISVNKSMCLQNLTFHYFLLTTKKELVRIMSRYPENMVEPERGRAEC